MKTEIAVIGNGCAAQAAVEALQEAGFTGKIDVFSDSRMPAYNPMLTTYYLDGAIPYDLFLLPELTGVEVHRETAVARLYGKEKYLITDTGERVDFDRCLIASGASPFVPPIEGCEEAGVFTVRTAEDVAQIQAYMAMYPVQKALVVGTSMVGIKVAEFLLHQGVACCMADAAPYMFGQAAHPNCAARIEAAMRQQGVTLRMGAGITGIRRQGERLAAYFSDGDEPTEADVIFLCIGVRPNLSFVDPEEIPTDRGILVNDRMETGCEGIYAAGDCTAGYDVYEKKPRNLGLLDNARRQGRTAGRNLAGQDCSYGGSTAHNITHFLDMDFVGIGAPLAEGEVYEKDLGENRYLRIVSQKGRPVSVNLLNLKELAGVLKNLFFRDLEGEAAQGAAAPGYEEFVSEWIKKYIGG